MNDPLEDFIKNKREEFEVELPENDAWMKIQAARSKANQKSIRMTPVWSFIGKAAVFFGVLFIAYQIVNPKKSIETTAVEPEGQRSVPQELIELENHYDRAFNDEWASFSSQAEHNPALYSDVQKEIETLNQEKQLLINEYGKDLSNEKIIEELISVYRIRLDILDEVRNMLNEENENHENDQSI